MSKANKTIRNTAQVQGVHLEPVVCTTPDEVFNAAFDGIRRRPVVAVNAQGVEIVCCSRTAKKHGWKVVEKLFQRTTAKAPAPAKAKPAQRAADLAAVEAMLAPKKPSVLKEVMQGMAADIKAGKSTKS